MGLPVPARTSTAAPPALSRAWWSAIQAASPRGRAGTSSPALTPELPAREPLGRAPLGLPNWSTWTRHALDGLADAAPLGGGTLALTWRFCCDNCGASTRVPAVVAERHAGLVWGLGPVEMDRYCAKLRELGGDDAGR